MSWLHDWTGDWDTADSRCLKADAEADAGFKVDMDQMLEDKKKEEAAAAAAPRRNVHSTDDQSACGKTFISDKSFDDEASLISLGEVTQEGDSEAGASDGPGST